MHHVALAYRVACSAHSPCATVTLPLGWQGLTILPKKIAGSQDLVVPYFLLICPWFVDLSIAKLSTLLEISHLTNLDRLLSFIVYPHMALAWRYVATSHEIGLCIVDCAEACMLRRTCRVSLPPSFKQFGRAVRITAYFELRVTWLQGIHIAYRWGVIVPCRSSRQARAAAGETGTFQFT